MQAGAPIITPANIAVNGAYALDHDALANNAIVHSPANYHLIVRLHPFNLASDGPESPAAFVEYAEARQFAGIDLTVQDDVVRDGRSWMLLKTNNDDDSHNTHYYLDPARGYLPFIVETYTKDAKPTLFSRMYLLDVHEEGGAYFPMHAKLMIPRTPPGRDPYVQVREMKVLELDLNYRPTDEDLTLQLPKMTQFYDGVDPYTSKTLYRDAQTDFVPVAARDIEKLYKELQAVATQPRRPSPPAGAVQHLCKVRAIGGFISWWVRMPRSSWPFWHSSLYAGQGARTTRSRAAYRGNACARRRGLARRIGDDPLF